MRKSIRASRSRLLAAAVGVLLAGGAAAAVMAPAGAAVSPVTISNPGTQDTHPLGSAVDVKFTAGDTDSSGLPLAFSSTALPAGLAINPTTGEITGTTTTPFNRSVTVTATDQNAATATATFDWTVQN